MKTAKVIALPISLLLAGPALAHPGHGDSTWAGSVLHYLLEPEHLPVVLLASLVAFFVGMRAAGRLAQRAERLRHG